MEHRCLLGRSKCEICVPTNKQWMTKMCKHAFSHARTHAHPYPCACSGSKVFVAADTYAYIYATKHALCTVEFMHFAQNALRHIMQQPCRTHTHAHMKCGFVYMHSHTSLHLYVYVCVHFVASNNVFISVQSFIRYWGDSTAFNGGNGIISNISSSTSCCWVRSYCYFC